MTPDEYLVKLIEREFEKAPAKWSLGKFRHIKYLSTTGKGNIAEDFAMWLGKHHGLDTHRNESRRGQYDVMMGGKTFEVKMASEDTSGSFQFGGIRYDTKYELLLVIGISPDVALFNLYKRKDLMDMPLVSMAKGSNAGFKLTRRSADLLPLSDFAKTFLGHSSA